MNRSISCFLTFSTKHSLAKDFVISFSTLTMRKARPPEAASALIKENSKLVSES
jgi:hypothetical protein